MTSRESLTPRLERVEALGLEIPEVLRPVVADGRGDNVVVDIPAQVHREVQHRVVDLGFAQEPEVEAAPVSGGVIARPRIAEGLAVPPRADEVPQSIGMRVPAACGQAERQ